MVFTNGHKFVVPDGKHVLVVNHDHFRGTLPLLCFEVFEIYPFSKFWGLWESLSFKASAMVRFDSAWMNASLAFAMAFKCEAILFDMSAGLSRLEGASSLGEPQCSCQTLTWMD